MINSVADKIGRGQKLTASEREEFAEFFARSQQIAARVLATDHGGGSRSQNIRRLVVDGDLDVPTGTVRIGPVAANKGNILLSSGGIKLRTNTTTKIDLQSDGDIFIGENTAAPGTTYFSIFVNAQTYNSESMSAGDMLIGDNSASKANILWDKSAGELLFRGGTTSKISIDTSGKLNIVADGTGYFYWRDGSTIVHVIAATSTVWSLSTGGGQGTGYNGQISLDTMTSAGALSANIHIVASSDNINLEAATTTVTGNLDMATGKWIGLASNAGRLLFTDTTADTITVDDADLLIETSRYVGLGTSAGRIVFTDAATDSVQVSSAKLVVDNYIEVNGQNSGANITLASGAATQIGLAWNQSGTGSGIMYMPASTNKIIFQGGGNNNLAIDMTNRRIGILNDSPSYVLDVNGTSNFEGVIHTNGATTPTSMASGLTLKNDTAPASSPTDQVSIYAGDAGGTAGKSWLLMRPEDGTARTVLGTTGTQGVSSGTGTVKMNGTTSRNSVGWLTTHDEDGTTIYIPYWTTVTG